MRRRGARLIGHLVDRTDGVSALDLSSRWQPMRLDDYFIDMRYKIGEIPRDTDLRIAKLEAGLPVQVCQWGIAFYQEANAQKGGGSLDWFMKCADLLVQRQEQEGYLQGALLHDVPSPYCSQIPWISAMAQGEALSVLVRAHTLAPSCSRYEAAARRAVVPFLRTIDEGGVVSGSGHGQVCFEEYPSYPPSHVLNGWIFAWMGLKEYACAFEDQAAHAVAQRSLESLGAMLPAYDTDYWSSYDLFPGFAVRFLASRFYHRLHIAQLTALHKVSGRDVFLAYASRWSGYLKAASCNLRYSLHRLRFKTYCLLAGWR